jgi:hypothetical protein
MKRDAKDDKAARKSRADSLRERIGQLVRGDRLGGSECEDESEPSKENREGSAHTPRRESPREFIERRMRELERKKRKKLDKS